MSRVNGLSERRPFSARSFFVRWEWILIFLIIAVTIINSNITPHFFTLRGLFDMTFNFAEKGIGALIMSLIIIIGQIDLSVGSNMAMSAVVMSISYQMGLNIWLAILAGLVVGTLGGLFNGFVITRLKLHSIIITLGTYSLYRGIAYVILGDKAVTGFSQKFMYMGQGYIANSLVPVELVIFIVLAVIFGIILHKTKFGRYMYAIGNNELACRYSGVPVDRVIISLYTTSGFMAALVGMLFVSRVSVCRPNLGEAFLFEVVTIVLLGGISIYGGEGTMIGVVLSILLIGLTRYGMLLLNVSAPLISVFIGFSLIIVILIPKVVKYITREQKGR